MRRRSALAAALLAVGLSSSAGAEQPPAERPADEITVIGERDAALTVDDLDEARARLALRPGGTALVDAASYADRRVGTLTDALGFAPGVFVQPRFGAEEARLSVRGSGLQRTFHLRGVRLLQDGVPVTLADGSADFQAIEPLAARYVEVYRGANALEYGAADLGGAINFVSPTGRDGERRVRVEGGAFGYRRVHAAGGLESDARDGFLSLSAFEQDGFRDHARQETYRLFGNYGFRHSPRAETRVYLTHVRTRSELPGSLTAAELAADRTRAAPDHVTNDHRRDFDLTRVSARTARILDGGARIDASFFYSHKDLDHPIFQVLRQESADYGLDLRYRSERGSGERRRVLLAGLSAVRGELDDDRFVNAGGRPGARVNALAQTASSVAAFVELERHLAPALALVAGGQLVTARRESRDRLVTAFDESFARSYRRVNPKLGVRFEASEAVQLFANVSGSFEPPTFGELAGGPNVTPVDTQRAVTVETGARVAGERVQADVALYHARVHGELLSLTDLAGDPLGTVNADRTRHRGAEAAVTWRAADVVTVRAAYLWNDFRFDGDAVFGDNRIAGVPPHVLRAEARVGGPRLYAAPGVEWVPDDYPIDHAGSRLAPGYTVWGLRIGGRTAWGEWFVDGRNLGDRAYVATTGVVANAAGADVRQLLPGDGRAVYVGFDWQFE
ncbi:MAG TPA: TonB-dependent receptor [Gammaproteobacteria bacterium]